MCSQGVPITDHNDTEWYFPFPRTHLVILTSKMVDEIASTIYTHLLKDDVYILVY